MVNATEMAKPFGRRVAHWLENDQTKQFLSALKTIRNSDSLIQAVEGRNGGTWMHEDVTMEFAQRNNRNKPPMMTPSETENE